MSDLYTELIVKRKTPTIDKVKKFGLIAVTVIAILLALLSANMIIFVVAVGLGVLSYLFVPSFDLEYEYLYVNGELDVDKIMSRTKRKRLISLNMKELQLLAPSTSHQLDYHNGNTKIKTYDFSSLEPDAKTYTMIIGGDKGVVRVIFEPNDIIVDHIKNIAPRKVFKD